MKRPAEFCVSFAAAILLAGACAIYGAQGQNLEREQTARARVLPEIGPGLMALKRGPDGRYFVLTAPGKSVGIYSGEGKKTGQIPKANSGSASIVFAGDIDVDAGGRLFVADRGANAVKIFSGDGSLVATISVPAPGSVAALPGGEFAVAPLRANRAVSIYSEQGKLLRSFGEVSAGEAANRGFVLGRVLSDAAANVYLALLSVPEAPVAKFDRYGYAAWEASPLADEITLEPTDKTRVGFTLEKRNEPRPKPAINALGVDAASGESWVAVGNTLLDYDAEGTRRAIWHVFTPEGTRLEPQIIVAEPNRILLGEDPLGIFEFPRPEKAGKAAAAK